MAAEGNESFLDKTCGNRKIHEVLMSIGTTIVDGTFNGVRMDQESALVYSPAHFTWMDTDHPAGTRRQGYPVEIQALWIEALDLLVRIDGREPADDPEVPPVFIGFQPPDSGADEEPTPDWAGLKTLARENLHRFFWQEEEGYFSDCLHTDGYMPASQAIPDDALRPNQLLVVTLGAVNDRNTARRVLAACEELLVPGAIRSLADRPVKHQLAVYHNGELLNDPEHPYQGTYAGDEDTRRKPAYHNGTAWTWQFPLYSEAWAWAYGRPGKQTALAWLTSSIRLMDSGCVGQIPEILDGDIPHHQRGCDAQAWGVSEWVRVWKKIRTRL
jgi:glycogen debranching enzyme